MSATTLTLTPQRRRAFGRLVNTEMKLAWRRPAPLLIAIGVPLVLLVTFGSIPATTRPDASLGGISFFNLYVPSLLVFVLIVVGLMGVPQQLATYRQQGVLRRMSTTPVPPAWLLFAQVMVYIGFAVIAIVTMLVVGAIAFNLTLPGSVGGALSVIAALLLCAAALLGLGLCVAARARTPQIAQGLCVVCFYPLMFFSGMYVPLSSIHSHVIHQLAKILPTGAGFNAIHAAFTNHSPGAEPLLVLAAWAIGCTVIAARFFRWE